MKYTVEESLTQFKFWSGGKDRADILTYSELEELDSFLEDLFADKPGGGQQIPILMTYSGLTLSFWSRRDSATNMTNSKTS